MDTIRDDLDEIVLNEDMLELVLKTDNPKKKAKEFQIKLTSRLRKHMGDPRYQKLSERLEKLKEQHETGQKLSRDFLKELLELARDLVNLEREVPTEKAEEDQGVSALTALFEEARNDKTPIMVERIVEDIDEIVRIVRFDGWQATSAGERELRKALRKTLFKYKLHSDSELFDKAYGYIREYY